MEMKTLLERAKPELKKAIATFKVDFPNTAEQVEEALSRTYGVSFLTYGIVIDICSIAFAAKLKFNSNDPWSLFEEK